MEGTSSKRDRESEGETPKPDTKSKKSGENDEEMDLHHKLDIFSKQMERLLSNQIDMKSNQESLRLTFETQLENLKTELIENMNSKIQILRDEISMDMTAERLRIDGLVNTVDDLQAKISTLECRVATSNHVNPLDNNDVTVVVFGLKFDDGEQKAQQLINSLGHEITNSVTMLLANLGQENPTKTDWSKLVLIQKKNEMLCYGTSENLETQLPTRMYTFQGPSHYMKEQWRQTLGPWPDYFQIQFSKLILMVSSTVIKAGGW
ncbi:hypothetical protein SNE40_021161 [Patella caerulea]|uniref:Uncharacterized protein n=1 Tax=Patella caerulea TaxID=87958 RepID=A0AAN8G7K5_PATCE